jgi:hypothetical protein
MGRFGHLGAVGGVKLGEKLSAGAATSKASTLASGAIAATMLLINSGSIAPRLETERRLRRVGLEAVLARVDLGRQAA